MMPPKAQPNDFLGRFREVISDPLNLLIERVPMAGIVEANEVHLHNGLRVPLAGEGAYYGAFSQLLVINRGVHEPLEEYVFQELLKTLPEAPKMVELGAYWGHYSMWLKKLRPRSDVILVEPGEINLAAGANNFSRNGLNGEFIQSFVGRGHLEIDSFMKSRLLTHLNILHVDIQGYEVEMLDGCHDSLSQQKIDYLFISTHSQEIHKGVVSKLNSLGYNVEVECDFDDDTTSYDGLVFASSPSAMRVFRHFGVMGRTKIAKSSPQELLKGLLGIQRRDSNSAT
jgi:methyltransferase FkbM-like protein